MGSEMVALEQDGPSQSVEPVNAVVFIHGIFSSHQTFIPMFRQLADRQDLVDQSVEFLSYDYDFHRSLESNGLSFAAALRRRFRDEDRVVIVAHSMGGLVSRLALLSQKMTFVRLLLLLATPNSGAIRLSQLGLLSQLAHAGTGGLFALFPRVSGISELSRASKILEARSEDVRNVAQICYVSVPGLLFRADQGLLEDIDAWSSIAFATIARASELLSALNPMAAIKISRPHDGIVEETSNNLIKAPRGRWHEKKASTTRQRGGLPVTYAHVTAPACGKLNHMQVQSDPAVIKIVGDIAAKTFEVPVVGATGNCIERWEASLSPDDRYGLEIAFD
nr:alpha/beta hydrolase [Bradyrhizobium symbiodeficiens]QIP02994.1 alpha/beta hydrolase [Bradyrhizobium symbiodeficiens]